MLARAVAMCLVAAAALGCGRSGVQDRLHDAGPSDAGVDARDSSADAGVDTGRDAGAAPDAGCATHVGARLGAHTCAVSCGDVWCWGRNGFGQLGDGTVHSRGTPRRVEGVRARQIGTSGERSCAVLEDGHVACWGLRVAAGTAASPRELEARRPEVVAGIDEVAEISVNAGAACALRGGEVWCWGDTGDGAAGPCPDAACFVEAPRRMDGLRDVVQITSSSFATCALERAGAVRCWGYLWGAYPIAVALPGPARSIGRSCAILGDAPYCWGHDYLSLAFVPARAVALPEPVGLVAGDQTSACAIAASGRLWCWGNNTFGGLGAGDTEPHDGPVVVEGLRAEGVSRGCAWARGGQVWCWGWAAAGNAGDGREPRSTRPLEVRGVGVSEGVSVGYWHACAHGGGDAVCWGTSGFGEVGSGRLGVFPEPVRVAVPDVHQIVATLFGSCAIGSGGGLWCWGWDATRTEFLPITLMLEPAVEPIGRDVAGIGLFENGCALLLDGSVSCWGVLPRGDGWAWVPAPGEPRFPPGSAERVIVGLETRCVIDAASTLVCEGDNESGDLGVGGPTGPGETPRLVVPDVVAASVGEGLTMRSLSMRRASCLVRRDGMLACWGFNGFGQVGDGTYDDRVVPTVMTALPDVRAVDVGATHTCAIDAAGAAWCWGDNRFGQLGDGTEDPSPVPVRVLLEEPATSISAGTDTTCAQVASGRTFCWGSDAYSILGRTDPPPILTRPHRVVLGP